MSGTVAGTDRATRVLAPNPGPMTLEGTNTWVLGEPGASACLVVDPGPENPAHRAAVVAAAGDRRVAAILLTHGHADHAAGARGLARATGAGVRALDPAHRLGDEGLAAGDVVGTGGLEVRVVASPGHSADSLCFHLPADRALLTGDTVLGRGTAVVAHPDGHLAAYLASLDRLRDLAGELDVLLPGHGPTVRDPVGMLDHYLRHRAERLAQVADAVAGGATTPRAVVEVVYAGVDRALWRAAEMSVRAQLDYLAERGPA